MNDKKIQGYIAGIICILMSGCLGILVINEGWNQSSQIWTLFSSIFGLLGIGGIIFPETIGSIAQEFLRRTQGEGNNSSITSYSQKGGKNSKNYQGENVAVTYNYGTKTKSRK